MLVEKKEVGKMEAGLTDLLDCMRAERKFSPQECLKSKVDLINSYFRKNGLKAAVLGLSGGIDSAVVLGLLTEAARQKDSPIERIVTAAIPFTVDQGASNQEQARQKAQAVARHFKAEFITLELGDGFRSVRQTVQSALKQGSNPWADGQLVSYLRTPALYYLSAVLTAGNQPAIVSGTTNRDEGAYLGFFGKASDGMVDLQLISDLHKSEVYQLADLLKVPASTTKAAPTGDVFDGKTHLEMIGTPYDFVELYMHWLNAPVVKRQQWFSGLDNASQQQFQEWAQLIEDMHKYNAHKYVGGNPSVHLDLYPRAVAGGWIEQGSYKLPKRKLVGEFDLDTLSLLSFNLSARLAPVKTELQDLGGFAATFANALTRSESDILYKQAEQQKLLAVGRNGMLKDYQPGDPIGSYRTSMYSPELADILWQRIKPFFSESRKFDEYATTDWNEHEEWKAVGINPAFRYIWYEKGGDLVVHYDAGYNPQDGKTHSMLSLVIYLTDGDLEFGGATRFIKDPQLSLKYSERDFSDWSREARQDEVLSVINPEKGKLLIFDHRLLHDAEIWSGPHPRVIIRTDIMFEKV